MTINASSDFDPSTTLDFWVFVPHIEDANERDSWAAVVAGQAAEIRGLDETAVPGIAQLLSGLAMRGTDLEGSWQLLFFVQPEFGATVWELMFLDPDPTISQDTLVGADVEAQLGNNIRHFEFHGNSGLECVRFGLVDADATGEQSIEAIALSTVARDLGGRPTTLLAHTQTIHLESMATSLVALQYLLASPFLEELVASTLTEPSGNPA